MEPLTNSSASDAPPVAGDPAAQLRPVGPAPAPPAMPILGWRGNAIRFFRNPIRYMSDLRSTYGPVACLVQGQSPTVFFRPTGLESRTYFAFGAENNRRVLTSIDDFQTGRPRGPKTRAFDLLSNNILTMNGAKHDEQRRLLMPAFTREHLHRYHNDIVENTEEHLRGWRPGERRDMLSEMTRLTLAISTKTLFGLNPTTDSRSLALKIRQMVDVLFSPLAMVPLDLPGTPYRKLRLNLEETVTSLQTEIARKRAQGSPGEDFLSMMIAAHDEDAGRLSDDELVSQSFVVFFAGHDTTSCALTWTLFLLATHPHVASELLDELDEHLAGAPPTYEQTYSLSVLDRVIKESLRVLSPGVIFPRIAVRDTTLGEFEIAAGSEVLFSPYITHHDPTIYPEPNCFRPERWLSLKPSAYEYLPFGAGPRKCIGAGLGTIQLKVIVALILQHYRLGLVDGTKIDPHVNVVMSPKRGLPMTIHTQDRKFSLSRAKIGGYIRQMVTL